MADKTILDLDEITGAVVATDQFYSVRGTGVGRDKKVLGSKLIPITITQDTSGAIDLGTYFGDLVIVSTPGADITLTFSNTLPVGRKLTIINKSTSYTIICAGTILNSCSKKESISFITDASIIRSPGFHRQIFTANGTWIKPANVSQIKCLLVGGGGAGGAGGTNGGSEYAGGGGGAGAVIETVIPIVDDLDITVGATGNTVITDGVTTITANAGADGGNYATGVGGSGGGAGAGGGGGAGGSSRTSSTGRAGGASTGLGGLGAFSGASGGSGDGGGGAGGAGGGYGIAGTKGVDSSNGDAGGGGGAGGYGGAGGAGGYGNAGVAHNGYPGEGYGGGGGGGGYGAGGGRTLGGEGGAGLCIIEWAE